MFENIIEQNAVSQLRDDLLTGQFSPSVLFYGPQDSGKGSAALELARTLSCEERGDWKCSCSACERHRYLQHDDLLILGKKSFSQEINACSKAFMRNPSAVGAKLLFFRSLRKLQIRFSPVLMEDDPKFSKIASVIQSFDEGLNEFLLMNTADNTADNSALEKICASLVKNAAALDEEGISSLIPTGQIRSAAYWCRLAPNGKRKTLIIENAQNMRDEARNSLLKILEEPPASVSIVLTALRREALIPTILSRVRPYRFLKRSIESEKDVIRRVFQDTINEKPLNTGGSLVSAYLESFLPQNTEKLYPLAQWFVKPDNTETTTGIVKTLLAKTGNFEEDSFSRFLKICLEIASSSAREADNPLYIKKYALYKKYVNEAVAAVEVYNQSPALALEALLYKIKKGKVITGD